MINLFNIPDYTIHTSNFSSLLHDKIVNEFTNNFCNYVGVKYGCAVNSASSIIYLLSLCKNIQFNIPTMIPPVVLNSIINGGSRYILTDDVDWVGHSYVMYNRENIKIIDSAQEVKRVALEDKDMIIYSFYPTKPVGSCDGGMICSNNETVIRYFQQAVMNGTKQNENSWNRTILFPGWKMYMNSMQAYIANENLKKLNEKKEKLDKIRNIYNTEFNLQNSSDHLYRIRVSHNRRFVRYMLEKNIVCGIHYDCTHKNQIYSKVMQSLPKSEELEKHTVSIPFHENLTEQNIEEIIKWTNSTGMRI